MNTGGSPICVDWTVMYRLRFSELTRQLADFYDFFETSDPEDAALTARALHMYRQNAVYAVSNDAHHRSIANMRLHLFAFPRSERNSPLYRDTSSGYLQKIFLIVEENTCYTASNCNRLYLESRLLLGVDECDIQYRTLFYLDYQCCKKWYRERYDESGIGILRDSGQ